MPTHGGEIVKRNVIRILISLALCVYVPAGVLADLVDAPHKFGDNFWLIQYEGLLVEYNPTVSEVIAGLGEVNVGTIDFDYRLFKGNWKGPGNPLTDGGAGLWGNFTETLPPGVSRAPNFDLHWVQVVQATNAGVQQWGAGPDEWFVDNGGSFTDPWYPADPFNDYPNRELSADQYWHAELALAGINATAKEMRIIGSVMWGFDIAAGDVQEGSLYGNPSPTWGAPLPSFSEAVLRDWPGVNDFHDWTVNELAVWVPEPSTALLLLVIAAITRRRYPRSA